MSVSSNWNHTRANSHSQVRRTPISFPLQHPTATRTVSPARDSLAMITLPAGPALYIALCRRVFPLSAPPRTPDLTEAGSTTRTSFFEWRDRGY